MKRTSILFVLAVALALAAPASWAATETADLTVTAEYYTPSFVTIEFVDWMDFSPDVSSYYHPGQAGPLDASAFIEVYSQPFGRTFSVYCDDGVNASGGQKRMGNGAGGYLEYGLFQDGTYGDAVPGSAGGWTHGTSSYGYQTVWIYGRIPGSQSVADGFFDDDVTFTVEYTP